MKPAFPIVALLMACQPVPAATVMDPDAPRFAEGLRVLGMRGEVEVLRLDQYAMLDREPLYLARTATREAVFREGDDACMSKVAVGVFVPCDNAIPAAQEQVDAVREAALTPATVGTGAYPTHGLYRPGLPGTGLPWWPCCGGGGGTPPTVTPPVVTPPVTPAPVPLPAAGWLLMGAICAVRIIRRMQ